MPYRVEHQPRKDGKNWVIINEDTGEVVGHSTSKKKANASVRARLAGKHGWHGTRGKK